jgi:hypothetical protein
MGVESAADRAVFVNPDDFGVTGFYSQNGGAEVEISGIFDNAHLMVDQGEAGVSSLAPVFTCRTADLEAMVMAAARRDDELRIGAVYYAVTDIQPDGTGMTTLILEKRLG